MKKPLPKLPMGFTELVFPVKRHTRANFRGTGDRGTDFNVRANEGRAIETSYDVFIDSKHICKHTPWKLRERVSWAERLWHGRTDPTEHEHEISKTKWFYYTPLLEEEVHIVFEKMQRAYDVLLRARMGEQAEKALAKKEVTDHFAEKWGERENKC